MSIISLFQLELVRDGGNKAELKSLAQSAWADRVHSAHDIARATGYSPKTIASWPRPAAAPDYIAIGEVVEQSTDESTGFEAFEVIPEPAPVVKDAVKPFKGVNYKNANDARIARNGYLSALQDIAHALAEGGEDRVAQWIQDNGAGKVVLGVDFPA